MYDLLNIALLNSGNVGPIHPKKSNGSLALKELYRDFRRSAHWRTWLYHHPSTSRRIASHRELTRTHQCNRSPWTERKLDLLEAESSTVSTRNHPDHHYHEPHVSGGRADVTISATDRLIIAQIAYTTASAVRHIWNDATKVKISIPIWLK